MGSVTCGVFQDITSIHLIYSYSLADAYTGLVPLLNESASMLTTGSVISSPCYPQLSRLRKDSPACKTFYIYQRGMCSTHSECLPATIINVALQSSGNQALDSTLQPHLPKQYVISLLVQELLMMTSQSRVYLPVLVQIRSHRPRTVVEVQEYDHAFANIDVETYMATAPVATISKYPYSLLSNSYLAWCLLQLPRLSAVIQHTA